MKKKYDYENEQRKKLAFIDFGFNLLLTILVIFIFLGIFFFMKEFNMHKYTALPVLGLLMGGAYIYVHHKDSERYFNRKAVERHLKKPKFKYLSDEQIQEIILEINYLL